MENELNPDPNRREKIAELLQAATHWVAHGPKVEQRAKQLVKLGRPAFDAYHIASAEAGHCDRVVTCDDRLLKACNRAAAKINVVVTEPLAFASEADF